jgi:hypothetical protein
MPISVSLRRFRTLQEYLSRHEDHEWIMRIPAQCPGCISPLDERAVTGLWLRTDYSGSLCFIRDCDPYHLRFVLRGVYLETRFDRLLLDLYAVGTVTRPLHSEKRQAWCLSSCWLRLLFALEFSLQQTNAAVGRVSETYRHCLPSYSNLST